MDCPVEINGLTHCKQRLLCGTFTVRFGQVLWIAPIQHFCGKHTRKMLFEHQRHTSEPVEAIHSNAPKRAPFGRPSVCKPTATSPERHKFLRVEYALAKIPARGWNGVLLSLVAFLGTWTCGGEQNGQWVWGTTISPLSFPPWDLKAAQISLGLNSPFRQCFLTKSFAPTSLMPVRKPTLLHHVGYTHLGPMGGEIYSSDLSSLSFLSFFQVLLVVPIGIPWS